MSDQEHEQYLKSRIKYLEGQCETGLESDKLILGYIERFCNKPFDAHFGGSVIHLAVGSALGFLARVAISYKKECQELKNLLKQAEISYDPDNKCYECAWCSTPEHERTKVKHKTHCRAFNEDGTVKTSMSRSRIKDTPGDEP